MLLGQSVRQYVTRSDPKIPKLIVSLEKSGSTAKVLVNFYIIFIYIYMYVLLSDWAFYCI